MTSTDVRRAPWRRALALLSCLCAAGCAATSDFSSLAYGYNEAASRSNDDLLLLNILRAAHRAPLQFTALQSITGTIQAGASGTLNLTPTGHNGSVMVGGMESSGLSAVFLDTKEFYSGMTAAVPGAIIDNLFADSPSNGLNAELLFERIVVALPEERRCGDRPNATSCKRAFHNDPRNARDFALFQFMLQQLFAAGLSTETIPRPDRPAKGKDDRFRDANLIEIPDDVHFCFESTLKPEAHPLLSPDRSAECSDKGGAARAGTRPDVKIALTIGDRLPGAVERILFDSGGCDTPTRVHRFDGDQDPDSSDCAIMDSLKAMRGKHVEVTLPVRSAIRIIEYLGSFASFAVRGLPPPLVRLSSGVPEAPCAVDPSGCEPLFVLRDGAGPYDIAAAYQGRVYAIPDDPGDARGALSRLALSTLRQIIALSTSSKDLPKPAVLTVVP